MIRLGLLLLAMAGLSGCLGCTLIGCASGVSIDLLSDTSIADGTYAITLVGENGEGGNCTIELDATSVDPQSVLCDPGLFAGVLVGASTRDAFLIEAPQLGDEVTIEITQDGAAFFDDTLALEYSTFSPNGDRCGPTCTQASVQVML